MKVAPQAATVAHVFQATADAHAGEPAIRSHEYGVDWTWDDYRRLVRRCAAGLVELGGRRGDTLACWLTNRPEFHAVDTAAVHLGMASFSVYSTYTTEQAAHVIGDAGAHILVTEMAFLERALAVRALDTTALETIVCVDGTHPATVSWDELLERGSRRFDPEAAARAVTPADLLTLIYTSGTTGPPKGVELTHANVMATVAGVTERLRLTTGMRAISWLPMAHIAERLCTHYLALTHGWQVTTCADPRAVVPVLAKVRPEFFFSPPRLWEKLRASVLARFDGDLELAASQRDAVLRSLGLDQARIAVVGAAPCPPEVIDFWHQLGIPLGEVYGASETTGVATLNPPHAIKAGTTGPPLSGVEVKLSAVGEVLIQGPVVMKGYHNLPKETADAIDADGWLHTGDVGVVDEDGYLRIIDRIKEIIINAAGKNMSPANVEATLKSASPLIGHAVCIGDGRPYNTALIVLDPDVAAGRNPHDSETIALVQSAVDEANTRLARVEHIRRFRIIDSDWPPGGDELTPTMKLKRRPIAEKYAPEIEKLYP
ncbi:MAG TPA: AMP-binding protein, partial [Solirubrobacteraceae bacterium]|nr:AMP-binding protein [Solirubrobacteraceae bacterium]